MSYEAHNFLQTKRKIHEESRTDIDNKLYNKNKKKNKKKKKKNNNNNNIKNLDWSDEEDNNNLNNDIEWGLASLLTNIDLYSLPRRHLRRHLEARGKEAIGSKVQLVRQLEESLELEQLLAQAHADSLDSQFMLNADLEERGAVYGVGINLHGQLGLGDLDNRDFFEVIPETRGMGVKYVTTGVNISFAITEDNHVFTWGGNGEGAYGKKMKNDDVSFLRPQQIENLVGEDIVELSVGRNHVIAVSNGGDCYTWGTSGLCGELGHGVLKSNQLPLVNAGFPSYVQIHAVQAGEAHSIVLTRRGRLYSFGHGSDGRLGIGEERRKDVPRKISYYWPSPIPISGLDNVIIRKIACGSAHTLAMADFGIFSWGLGSGGRLGHGDTHNRDQPELIETLERKTIIDISAGTWHSAAIVQYPPMLSGGWVYTWGTGYHGQLGQYHKQQSFIPFVVDELKNLHILCSSISCGPYHNAVITNIGELYTWGSNRYYCLGRYIEELDIEYTAIPGHCGGFGSLVNRIGRGLPRSVSCGSYYTLVATYPYEGPNLEIAQKLMEEIAIREEQNILNQY